MQSKDIDELYRMTGPYQGDLIIYECNSYVDNGRNEGRRCMEPAVGKFAASRTE